MESSPTAANGSTSTPTLKTSIGSITTSTTTQLDDENNFEDEFTSFVQLAQSEKWTLKKTKNHIKISLLQEKSNQTHIFKGEAVLKHKIKDIYNCCKGSVFPQLLDPALVHSQVIATIDENTDLVYCRYSLLFPLKDRDFIRREARKSFKDVNGNPIHIILNNSIIENEILLSKCIRGHLYKSGWILQSTDTNETKVTYIIQLDAKGSVPKWCTNMVTMDEPLIIHRIDKFLTEKYEDYEKFVKKERRRNGSVGPNTMVVPLNALPPLAVGDELNNTTPPRVHGQGR